MSVPIRISEHEYEATKRAAKAHHRSIQGQAELWLKLGRCASENPDLPISMIQELLAMDREDTSDVTPFTFGQKE